MGALPLMRLAAFDEAERMGAERVDHQPVQGGIRANRLRSAFGLDTGLKRMSAGSREGAISPGSCPGAQIRGRYGLPATAAGLVWIAVAAATASSMLLSGGRTDTDNFNVEVQGLTRQRVVQVDGDLRLVYLGDAGRNLSAVRGVRAMA